MQRPPAGVPEEKLNPSFAIPACVSAVRTFPRSPRLNYQLGHAYWKSNNFAEAMVRSRQAAQYQYAPAEAILGYMSQFGQGAQNNLQKLAALIAKEEAEEHASAEAAKKEAEEKSAAEGL
jgi:hypothetical protein